MVPYLSRIEGPPPKRNVARSNRAGITIFWKFPRLEGKMLKPASYSKDGEFSFFVSFFPGIPANGKKAALADCKHFAQISNAAF